MTLLLYYSFDACVKGVEMPKWTWEMTITELHIVFFFFVCVCSLRLRIGRSAVVGLFRLTPRTITLVKERKEFVYLLVINALPTRVFHYCSPALSLIFWGVVDWSSRYFFSDYAQLEIIGLNLMCFIYVECHYKFFCSLRKYHIFKNSILKMCEYQKGSWNILNMFAGVAELHPEECWACLHRAGQRGKVGHPEHWCTNPFSCSISLSVSFQSPPLASLVISQFFGRHQSIPDPFDCVAIQYSRPQSRTERLRSESEDGWCWRLHSILSHPTGILGQGGRLSRKWWELWLLTPMWHQGSRFCCLSVYACLAEQSVFCS